MPTYNRLGRFFVEWVTRDHCVLVHTFNTFNVTRLGDLLDFGQLFKAKISLPKSLTFLGNFCKCVKIFNFSGEIIFGHFYRHLAIFYWSHWLGHTFNTFPPPSDAFVSTVQIFCITQMIQLWHLLANSQCCCFTSKQNISITVKKCGDKIGGE